jgi:hypothetical protein
MEIIVLLVVGIVVAWWLLSRERGKPYPSAQRRELVVAEPVREPTKKERSAEQKLADSLETLREAIREKADAEHRTLRDQLEDANERLAAARRLADRLGVASAVTKIAGEMEHWYSWSKSEDYDFSENLVDGLKYLGGDHTEVNGNKTTVNEFAFGGARYRMSLADEHYGIHSSSKYADLILECFDGTAYRRVFAAEIAQDIMREFAPWRALNVTTIELGTWVHGAVAPQELFIARRERDDLRRQAEYTLPKVKNLNRQEDSGEG